MGRYLGITLAGLANTLNPEMFVICGGVTAGWDAFAPMMLLRRSRSEHIRPPPFGRR